ncbi:hypothetical protein BDZ89DRAFT_1140788 [Hymenopellis radicata]|nr:hypothetical protein BDZ89DRAFT_1140788 [Hymenopellis radicata]
MAIPRARELSKLTPRCSLTGGVVKTPKKIKHKRTKVKMAILKYYKIDSDTKIKRLRRECPSVECGAGIFMAF